MNEQTLLVQPVPALEKLSRYTVGRPDFETDLILDFNESLEPLPLSGSGPAVPNANLYPWTDTLVALLAERLGVASDRVIVTCGADDALERAVRSVCCPGRRAVMMRPTYGMPRRYAILSGVEIDTVEWWGGAFPVEEVLATCADDTSLLFLVSPNNPTGSVITGDQFTEVIESLPQTLVILDQAYREFTDPEFDLTDIALAHPNAVLIRTFSKAWGGAGLRAGYAAGDTRVMDWMWRVGQPFPVSRLSLGILEQTIASGAEPARERVDRIRNERQRTTALLNELGAEALPSQASFVAARFADGPWVRTASAALGIAIRGFPGRDELAAWLRITMPGNDELFDRLEATLRTVLRPEALLFDMDGVIADESVSYRRAVVETAASFGVELAMADVNAAKAAGGANNDWALTRRLMAEAGTDVPLAEVTERFEALYQGTDDAPGLRRHERLLADPELLRELAGRMPLAVVTGRPRGDAHRFLAEHGISGIFSAVVVLDDAPSKPDPAPVHLAMDRLGVRHAWMVGDTPDDVRAARAAGVLPLGVVAPGDDHGVASPALAGAGAARILDTLDELKELLP